MRVKLLDYTLDSVIKKGYGICTGKPTIPKENLQKWIQMGHESPIEHSFASFRISEVSRACANQIVRHRLASYSQRSQRYCREEDWTPVLPETIYNNSDAKLMYDSFMSMTKATYKGLVEMFDIPEEDARYVLPNATPTELIMSANFREWRHFIKVRATEHAQWEIREVANRVLILLYHRVAPEVFSDLYLPEFSNAME